MITLNSEQKELDLKVKYLFSRVLVNVIVNDKLAMDAVTRLDALSNTNFSKASFKRALLKQYQEHAEVIKSRPEVVDIIVHCLPIYAEGNAHHLVSQDDSANAILIEKLFEDDEWVINIDELALVGKKLDSYDKTDAFCSLIENIFTEEYADFKYFTQKDGIIGPLLRMSETSRRATDLIVKHEDMLVDLIKRHRTTLTKDDYSHYLGGINILHADCVKFINIGAKSLAKASFEYSLGKLSVHDPISVFSEFAESLGENVTFRGEFIYRIFELFYSQLAPYKDNSFKFFAYAYMHSDFVDLPFLSDDKMGENMLKNIRREGLFLDKPEYINGLNSAIAATSIEHQDRVHKLIVKMKELVTKQDVLAEMARQIPPAYLQQHPDLKRHLLADDLSL